MFAGSMTAQPSAVFRLPSAVTALLGILPHASRAAQPVCSPP